MDLNNIETDSDESLSEDSLEVSDHVSSLARPEPGPTLSSPEKISCALCVSRNKGNSMETVRSFAIEIARKIFKFIKFMSVCFMSRRPCDMIIASFFNVH